MGKFTNKQKARIRQLVLEAEIQRFQRHEALIYINSRLQPDGIAISIEHYDDVKKYIRRNGLERMNKLQKSRRAYLDLFFQRIDEVVKLQQDNWALYHRNPDKPWIQIRVLQELHQLTITLANLYDTAPAISEIAGDISEHEAHLSEHQTTVSR
jgi:hypothetical protein